MGNVSTNVFSNFRCALTRRRTTRVPFWDPPSGSKNFHTSYYVIYIYITYYKFQAVGSNKHYCLNQLLLVPCTHYHTKWSIYGLLASSVLSLHQKLTGPIVQKLRDYQDTLRNSYNDKIYVENVQQKYLAISSRRQQLTAL